MKLEFDRVLENQKNCICFYFFLPSLLASFLLSFPPSVLFLFLSCFSVTKIKDEQCERARFMWLSFRGFHLKMPGEIQKGVALGTC